MLMSLKISSSPNSNSLSLKMVLLKQKSLINHFLSSSMRQHRKRCLKISFTMYQNHHLYSQASNCKEEWTSSKAWATKCLLTSVSWMQVTDPNKFNLWLQNSKYLKKSVFNRRSSTRGSGCLTSHRHIWCQWTSITSVSACSHRPKQGLSLWSRRPRPLLKRCPLVCRLNKTRTWTRTSSSTQWRRNTWEKLYGRHVPSISKQSLSRSDHSRCRCVRTRSPTLLETTSAKLYLISRCRSFSWQIKHESQKLTPRSGCCSKSSNRAAWRQPSRITTARCTPERIHSLSWLNLSSSLPIACSDSIHSRQLMVASGRSPLPWHHRISTWFQTMNYDDSGHCLQDPRASSKTKNAHKIKVLQNRELSQLK